MADGGLISSACVAASDACYYVADPHWMAPLPDSGAQILCLVTWEERREKRGERSVRKENRTADVRAYGETSQRER